jgi:tetratricopeptide (TPR) repeat protein
MAPYRIGTARTSGAAAMDTNLRNLIRDRLSRLQADNGETLFEQVCAEIARRRIHANIKMSSFVAGHGDKGRDFENVPGHDSHLVGSRGQEDNLKPDDTIVGACTLGRSDPPAKIRSDVQTIHTKGPRPTLIYYFCETDFPTAQQTDLSQWSKQTYGIGLHILTGNTLSDWLSEADLAVALNLLGLAAAPAPRCVLPPIDTEGFAGRHSELALLTEALIAGDAPVGGRIMGLYGPPGVGKSGLAVHFARLNRDRFPEGVIGADLRGVDDPFDALARLAVALGEPLTSDEQAWPPHQLAQSRFAHRQCLILLDNLEHASTLKQIRPGGRTAVLITCRDQDVLAQFAVPAERRRPVERLSRAEAVAYLKSALGSATHAPAELDNLADALRDLPLALRIGARRVMEDPIVKGRIERFVARLRAPTRLGELIVAGEADLDLVRLFDLSLETLNDGDRRAFACLSACTAEGFGARAAAAAMDRPDPMPLVTRLARLSLLEVDQSTTRFRFHALIDDYARHLADRWGLTSEARARHAQAMVNLLRANAGVQAADLGELLANQEDIRRGLEHFADTGHIDLALLQGLARLVEQTALGDWHSTLLTRLSRRLDRDSQTWLGAVLLLQQGKRDLALGRLEEARAAFERSLEIERALNNQRGEAMVLHSLGGVLRDLGQPEEARVAFECSLEILRVLHDQRGEAMVLNSLGGVLRDLGRPEEACAAFERSLGIGRALNDQRHEAMVLNSLGGVLRDLGRPEEARAAFERSLEIRRALNDQHGEAVVLHSLGGVLRDLGRPEEARTAFERSLEILRALNDQHGEAMVLNSLGGVLRDLGRLEEARAAFERSLEIERVLNNQRGEAMVLNSLGGLLRDLGRLEEARAAFERSLKIGRALNNQRHEAMVLNSLGWLFRELGDPDGALERLATARAIGKKLGLPFPAFFKAELTTLRKWSRQLATGTHTLAAYHLAMEKRRAIGKDWHGAILHMRHNLALDRDGPERRERTERLAYACFRAQRIPEAIDAYRSALEVGPLSPVGCANLGRALHLAGDYLDEAESHLRQAWQLQPDNAWASSWLGLLLADTGQLDEGELHARQALVGHEHNTGLLYNLAKVLARFPDNRRDNLAEALDICTNAEADFSFSWREDLAKELRQRLGYPASEMFDHTGPNGLTVEQ